MTIAFTVLGQAQTAGSKRAFPFKRGDGKLGVRVSDDNPKGQSWKHSVACAARQAYGNDLLSGPLSVTMRFYRPRPRGHFHKSGRLCKAGLESFAPATRPDVLKLARAAEDALTGIVWRDDAQIVEEHLFKQWGEPARLEVEIKELAQGEVSLFQSVKDERMPWEKTA